MREKLASVAVGDGREAAIWREGDGTVTWTAGRRGWGMRRGEAGAPFVLPVPGGTLLAGEIPPGAEAIAVRAPVQPRETVVAGGRYLAVLPEKVSGESVTVLARDAAGAIVPWPVVGETRRRVLADADISCPACGGRAWDVVWRPGARTTVCHTCGWSDGGWTDTGPGRATVRVELETVEPPLGDDPTVADVVAAAPFPVYGLVEEPADGFSFGWLDDGQVTSVGLRYESAGVELRTTTGSPSDGPVERARNALRNAVELEARDRDETLSVQARALRHSVQTRAIRARLGATPLDRVTISVDGRPTDFERHRDGSIEAAAAELDGVTVVIVSRKRPLAELALKRL